MLMNIKTNAQLKRRHTLRAGFRALCVMGVLAVTPSFAQDWQHYGGDAGGSRHSTLSQITADNVGDLKIAWQYQTGDMKSRPEDLKFSAFEATPILVEDSLVFCTPFNEVVALHPGTGRQLWRYDAAIATGYRPANQFVCRGVSYWQDTQAEPAQDCATRVYMGTNDARLIALDAKSGQPCQGFGKNGQIKIDIGMELIGPMEFQITSAPTVTRDVVVVGSSIGDNQRADAPKGTVRAFDARTGEPRWSFNPVIRGAQDLPDNWDADEALRTGHANVWAPMSADEELGLIYLPTSSPSPDFYGGEREGDNRYANSVVALQAETGAVAWHFQTVHHDVWDYDLPAQPSLVTLKRDEGDIPALIQVTKTGMVFVFNRATGEPVFAIEERPVPQGGVPGEHLSATQPFPVAPLPLVPHQVTADDAFGLAFFDKRWCAKQIKSLRNEGIYTPPSLGGSIEVPFTAGGANWGGIAFDPATQTMYVNTNRALHVITLIPSKDFEAVKQANPGREVSAQEGTPYAMRRDVLLSPLGIPCNRPPWGMLHAIDLSDGTLKWETVLGTVRDMAPFPIPMKWGTAALGAPIVTDGGVLFIGATMDDYLRAFNSRTGEEIWKGRLPAGGQATPMTYTWQDRQYVVIAAGGHSAATTTLGDYVVAFAIPD